MNKKTKDYRGIIQDVQQIICKWEDKLNRHQTAEKIVDLILSQHSICDHCPEDTKIWTISVVKNLKPYPFKK